MDVFKKLLLSGGGGDDWVDRANRLWTVLLLALCALAAFALRYIQDPIQCWTRAEFTGAMVNYAHSACFSQEVFTTQEDASIQVKSYHLWIPLILCCQALCFLAPHIIWRVCHRMFGVDVVEIVGTLENKSDSEPAYRHAAQMIYNLLSGNKIILALCFLVVKILYIVNLLGQFIFLTVFFHQDLAIGAGRALGFDYSGSVQPLLFKAVTCSYSIRQMGITKMFTSNCLFPITLVYEKLFVFLWYWVFFLSVLSVLNLLAWIGFLLIPPFRDRRISLYLQAFGDSASKSTSQVRSFVESHLGISGVYILSSMSTCNELVAGELTANLWKNFQEANVATEPSPTVNVTVAQPFEASNPIPTKGDMEEIELEPLSTNEKV